MAKFIKAKQVTHTQFPVKEISSSTFDPESAVGANNPRTIDAHISWNPSEMMAMLTKIPDWMRSPPSFVD